MRRTVWMLAIGGLLGLTFVSARAQDPFATSSESAAKRSPQFFSGQSAQAQPRRFLRNAGELPAGSSGEGLRNYYQELFSGETATAKAPTAEKAAEKTAEAPSAESNKPSDIVHAAYSAGSDESGESAIQQVRADRPSGRPFPATFSPSGAAEKKDASLTTPIATEPAEQPAPEAATAEVKAKPTAEAPAKPDTPRSNVTISGRTVAKSPARDVTFEGEAGPQTPAVKIEWVKKTDFNVGQESRCELVVTNTGKSTASAVEVEAYFPKTVRLTAAKPMPTKSEEYLGWSFDSLAAGESRIVEITMIPLERGEVATRANVRFTGQAAGTFNVAEPLLAVRIQGPTKVLVGEPASHTVVISNPGTGVATNVRLEALIPEGLEHVRGDRLLMDLGSLNPGESRSVRLSLAAAKGGTQLVQVQARADADLARTAASEVLVVAPSLITEIDGPGLRYLGRSATYTVRVANDGAAATENVRVMHKVPDGFQFVSSSRGAQFDETTRILNWFVGRLDAGQKAQIEVTLNAERIGEFEHRVRATSEHGSISDAMTKTVVEGASSLAIRVRDLDDPVEVGSEAAYEIVVKNEGSASSKGVGLSCEFPEGVTFVAAEGPSAHKAEEGRVQFAELAELGPGQSAVYRVKLSSSVTGHQRIRTLLTSESMAVPLTTEELTKFYGDVK